MHSLHDPSQPFAAGRGGAAQAAELGLRRVVLENRAIPAEVLTAVPRALMLEHTVLPFAREHGILQVAAADPLDTDVLDRISYAAGEPVQSALADEADIRRAIARCHSAPMRDEAAETAGLSS